MLVTLHRTDARAGPDCPASCIWSSASVPAAQPDKVSVIDQNSNLVSDPATPARPPDWTQARSYVRDIEEAYRHRIRGDPGAVVGSNVRAR